MSGADVERIPADETDRALAAAMMGLHDELDRRFFAHQQALLDRDFARAGATLARYADLLRRHVHDEQQHMLPRYAATGGDGGATPTRLFHGEHENLLRFVGEFERRAAALCAAPDDRSLLELFDRQATFKNLLLHHDLRERNVLYPWLSTRLSPAEQREIATACEGLRER